MATIRVLSLGTKFITKWRKANVKQTFQKFGDFQRRLQNTMFFLWKTNQEHFVWTDNFDLKVIMWQGTHLMKSTNSVDN